MSEEPNKTEKKPWPQRLDNWALTVLYPILRALSRILESLLKFVFVLSAFLLLCLMAASYVAYFGFDVNGWTARAVRPLKDLLKLLDDHWKAVLFLLIPIFYKEVKSLLRRFKSGWGIETHPRTVPEKNPKPKEKET